MSGKQGAGKGKKALLAYRGLRAFGGVKGSGHTVPEKKNRKKKLNG